MQMAMLLDCVACDFLFENFDFEFNAELFVMAKSAGKTADLICILFLPD